MGTQKDYLRLLIDPSSTQIKKIFQKSYQLLLPKLLL
jgi:hypothetical protein